MTSEQRNSLALWFESEMAEMADPAKQKKAKPIKIVPKEQIPQSWLKRHSVIITLIVSLVGGGLAGALVTRWFQHSADFSRLKINEQIDQRMAEPLGVLRDHTAQLSGIQTSVNDLKNSVDLLLKKELKILAQLPQKQFEQNLDALGMFLQMPVNEFKPDRGVLDAIAAKLRKTAQNTPVYWSTVLQFINFASAAISSEGVPPHGAQPSLVFSHNRGFGAYLGTRKNEVALLDGDVGNVRFEHCRIIFADTPVRMRNVVFVDCVFEFPVSNDPKPHLKSATQDLLASTDLEHVTVASLG
jgi:hypothetical protein